VSSFEAADSRLRKLLISPIALIMGAGNTTVVFFSTPSSAGTAADGYAI
jgi:hypothetical protein